MWHCPPHPPKAWWSTLLVESRRVDFTWIRKELQSHGRCSLDYLSVDFSSVWSGQPHTSEVYFSSIFFLSNKKKQWEMMPKSPRLWKFYLLLKFFLSMWLSLTELDLYHRTWSCAESWPKVIDTPSDGLAMSLCFEVDLCAPIHSAVLRIKII